MFVPLGAPSRRTVIFEYFRGLPASCPETAVFTETTVTTANINFANQFFVAIVNSSASRDFVFGATTGNFLLSQRIPCATVTTCFAQRYHSNLRFLQNASDFQATTIPSASALQLASWKSNRRKPVVLICTGGPVNVELPQHCHLSRSSSDSVAVRPLQ